MKEEERAEARPASSGDPGPAGGPGLALPSSQPLWTLWGSVCVTTGVLRELSLCACAPATPKPCHQQSPFSLSRRQVGAEFPVETPEARLTFIYGKRKREPAWEASQP